MNNDNLSKSKNNSNSKEEGKIEEIKGNKFIIALSNLLDPVNNKCPKNRNNLYHVFINGLL